MKNSICQCGNSKDKRAVMCRKCKDVESSKNPCNGCKRVLDISEYSLRPNGYGGFKRRSRCKKCESALAQTWRKENPEENKKRKKQWGIKYPEKLKRMVNRRGWRRKGLNPDIIEEYMLTHDCCEICGTKDDYQSLSVDHCHTTNKFRGILCSRCNSGIGFFKDNTTTLENAILYLKRSHS